MHVICVYHAVPYMILGKDMTAGIGRCDITAVTVEGDSDHRLQSPESERTIDVDLPRFFSECIIY